ncbi:AI-2E family transporter [Chitinophaga lutea]|uniref:AI-2E family transporter n=1 Tax=Chitinophaga lutea TaxID=2488634 RepID=A0A3N4PKA0_9BACT|nr:AI-2E family transporter [Chitinophaga lutea]RPE09102.1 AI-2E family transporter [Chitinophaga lutea]
MKPVSNKPPFYIKLSHTLLSLVLIVVILRTTKDILAPVAFGFIFSILLLPVAQGLEKLRLSRGLAATLSVVLFILCMFGLIYFISWQTSSFLTDLPSLEKRLMLQANNLTLWIDEKFKIDSDQQMAWINETAAKSISTVSQFVVNAVSSVSSILIFLVFIPLYTFFLLYYRRLLVRFLLRLFRREDAEEVHEVIAHGRSVIKSYVVGLFIEMLVVAVLNITALLLLGVQYAILLGTLGAIFNIIPYLGMVMTIIIVLMVTLTTGTPALAFWAAVSLFGIHLVDANVLLPRIVGSKVSINAMITLLGVFVGSMIWGIAGMFISIPAMALLKIIFDRIPNMKPWGILMGSGE